MAPGGDLDLFPLPAQRIPQSDKSCFLLVSRKLRPLMLLQPHFPLKNLEGTGERAERITKRHIGKTTLP